MNAKTSDPAGDVFATTGHKFGIALAGPPWQFQNRKGRVAPEYKRLNRCGTLSFGNARMSPPGLPQVDYIATRKRDPDEQCPVIDAWETPTRQSAT